MQMQMQIVNRFVLYFLSTFLGAAANANARHLRCFFFTAPLASVARYMALSPKKTPAPHVQIQAGSICRCPALYFVDPALLHFILFFYFLSISF
jgi:hypothetical protein